MRAPEILFEDKDIMICRKPAGVATQTKRLGQQDMESLLKNYRAKKGEPPYIGIVHRLDQPVEGVMVFAKNQKAAAGLSKQVQERVIGKYYYAVSASRTEANEGVLEDYLFTDKKANFTQVVDKETEENYLKEAKYAKLEYKVVETKEDKTLFDIKLHTGRQHQIRVQMAHVGCPLVGDGKYNTKQTTEVKGRASTELALCSYKLEFEHPTKKIPMQFEIQPLGEAFSRFFIDK
ncbi:MAG: RluA family pseudouridine synthase [Agathobacter sp.]|nr:RluA family pseudouridine synthase [Agathobacter sp.]